MKILRLLSVILMCSINALNAQVSDLQIPEFRNKVHFVESKSLVDLEKTELQAVLKQTISGIFVNLIADGRSSNIIHSGSNTDVYIVKIEPGIDPDNVVELIKFDESKKNRKILVTTWTNNNDPVKIPKAVLKFTKVADGVYAISTVQQLEGGEYVFMVNRPSISVGGVSTAQVMHGYCFKVPKK